MQPLHHYGSELAHNFYGNDGDFLDFYAPAHHDAYANHDDFHVHGLYNHYPYDLELTNLGAIENAIKSPTFQGFIKRGVFGIKNLDSQPTFAQGQRLIY